jgi:hypothetical protein
MVIRTYSLFHVYTIPCRRPAHTHVHHPARHQHDRPPVSTPTALLCPRCVGLLPSHGAAQGLREREGLVCLVDKGGGDRPLTYTQPSEGRGGVCL